MVVGLLFAQVAEPINTSTFRMAVITFFASAVALIITKLYEAWVKKSEHNKELKAKELEFKAQKETKALEAEIVRLAKEQEWKRQDEVARRVEATMEQAKVAAELLARQQKIDSEKMATAAERLLVSTAEAASRADATNTKLDVIHTWVNAKMTETMQSDLDSKEQALVLLLEMVDLKKVQGHVPSDETLGRIKAMSARIVELRGQLAERLKQQAVIDAKPVLK